MDSALGLIGSIVTAIGVLAAAWWTRGSSNRKLKTDGAQQMIDQLQEEGVRRDARIERLERIQRLQGDYIGELRRHIADGHPPPPPPFPEGLIT